MDCKLYVAARNKLYNELHDYGPLTLNTLLFGDLNLPLEDNVTIFKAVHQYILSTRRFDQ